MSQFLYSIIIPHKNIPHLLVRCLDSIQRNDNIQVIVVDDASSDENVEILKSISFNYPTFEFIFDKEGGGAGHARNIGLSRAQGVWVIFADADDFFSESAVVCLKSIEKTDLDVVYFKVKSVDSDTLHPTNRGDIYNQLVDDYIKKIKKSELNLRYRSLVPWGKVIKRSLIVENNIYFDEIMASNDVMFTTKIGLYAHQIEASDLYLYNVVTRSDSLVKTNTLGNRRCRFTTSLRRSEFLQMHSINIQEFSFIFYLLKSFRYGLTEVWWYINQLPLYKIKYTRAFYEALKWKLKGSYNRMV